jgi:hypothetical protein
MPWKFTLLQFMTALSKSSCTSHLWKTIVNFDTGMSNTLENGSACMKLVSNVSFAIHLSLGSSISNHKNLAKLPQLHLQICSLHVSLFLDVTIA